MALFGMLGIGIVGGIIAHLILGRNGYSYFGEIMLGCVGSLLFGMLAGIAFGMKTITFEVMAVAAIGALISLTIVVVLTLRTRVAA